jgi:hypothetical protein
MDGHNTEDAGLKLLNDFKTNFMMLLEYADALEGESQEVFLNELEKAVVEIDLFINDLDLDVELQ